MPENTHLHPTGQPDPSADIPETALQLRSRIGAAGRLELSLADVPVPRPGADEVLVRMQAAPINPSDLGLLLGPADLRTLEVGGTPERPVTTARIPPHAMASIADRVDVSMPVGIEGAGIVVAAGGSARAQSLIGRLVAAPGGASYAQFRCVRVDALLELPAGATAIDGASCFVNPLTALGMIETMIREGHEAIVHTAAASNLGRMLNRICLKDGIGLVNIVRRADQATLLRDEGATHVCDSSADSFVEDLRIALVDTGATIGFDATGGGPLAGQILSAMEAAALRRFRQPFSRYGSTVFKQVYLYGRLDPGPVTFARDFGSAWSLGGWLLFPRLERFGAETTQRLKDRVAAELKTTFASRYARRISLVQMLQPDLIADYSRRATGAKYVVEPNG